MPGALDGLRVLELATGVSGPYCGKLLAGLGADVLKIEPPGGDSTRLDGPFPGDMPDPEKSGLFLHLNTGKRSIPGPDEAGTRRLLRECDILILSHSTAELAAQGLAIPDLLRDFPPLVIVDVTSFGLTGPYADYLGGELVAYALGGYMMLTGAADREPLKSYGSLVGYKAGAHAALGALAAVFARELTGEGQLVDVSAMEAATFMLGAVEQNAHFYGRIARRNGTRLLGFPAEHSYPSTIRPCKDGFVHCHSNNRHLDLLGAMIPHPRLEAPDLLATMMGHADEIDEIMDKWLADKTRAEIVATAQEIRLPFTEVLEPREVAVDPHNIARGSFVTVEHPGAGPVLQPGAPMRLAASPWVTSPAPMLAQDAPRWLARDASARGHAASGANKPLDGVRVIDFTNAVAGPIAGFILADLGADVIKVEAPTARPLHAAGTAPLLPGGEDRGYDRMMTWNELNHGKRGVSLDVGTAEGRALFLELAAKSDIVIENFAPRVMGNLGIDYEELRKVNSAIICVSMPAFGLSGPYRERIAYGPGIDAMSGCSHLTGYADGPPMKPGNFFCDQNAGVHAAIATLAALRHRHATGEGQFVELAMIEGEFQILGDAYIDYATNGRERRRQGNDHPRWAPHDAFPCAGEDAWVAIAVESDEQWRALCAVIERADLSTDPRFARETDRHANRALLREPISAWTRGRTHYEAQHALQAAGVPAGAVLNCLELLHDPHVVARGGFTYVNVPNVGPAPYPRVAFTLSETPVPVSGPAPAFAQHNRAVFGDLLGHDDADLAAFEAAGVTASIPSGAH